MGEAELEIVFFSKETGKRLSDEDFYYNCYFVLDNKVYRNRNGIDLKASKHFYDLIEECPDIVWKIHYTN